MHGLVCAWPIRGSPARQPSSTNSISGALQATVCGRTACRAERGCRMLECSQLAHLHLHLHVQQLPPVHPYPGTERAQNNNGASRAALTREQAGYSRLEAIHQLLTNSVRLNGAKDLLFAEAHLHRALHPWHPHRSPSAAPTSGFSWREGT
jgi:hypothetical protein